MYSIYQELNINPCVHYRYVDDIIMTAPRELVDNIVTVFNSFH